MDCWLREGGGADKGGGQDTIHFIWSTSIIPTAGSTIKSSFGPRRLHHDNSMVLSLSNYGPHQTIKQTLSNIIKGKSQTFKCVRVEGLVQITLQVEMSKVLMDVLRRVCVDFSPLQKYLFNFILLK